MQRDVLLNTYLNDHVAAAEGGLRLVRSCLAQSRDEALAQVLPGIIQDLEEEQALLQNLAGRLPGQPGPFQRALAWLGALASRLKFRRWLFEYTPLSRLEELEALATGIQARRKLWVALEATRASDPRFSDVDFAGLRAQARRHHEQVEQHRREAARQAFGEPRGAGQAPE